MSIEEGTDNIMNIKKLVAGRFDMFIGVGITIRYLAKQIGALSVIEEIRMTETGEPFLLSASKTYIGLSKKTMTREMARRFSSVLVRMKSDGTVDTIMARYL